MAGTRVNCNRYKIQHEEKARLSPLLLNETDYTDVPKGGRKRFVQGWAEDKL